MHSPLNIIILFLFYLILITDKVVVEAIRPLQQTYHPAKSIGFVSHHVHIGEQQRERGMSFTARGKEELICPYRTDISKANTSNQSSRPQLLLLRYTRYDSLVSGIAEINMGISIGVLMSEWSILTTGCGPTGMSDFLERSCYQGVIVASGLILFSRITTGRDSATISEDYFGPLEEFTLVQVRFSEVLTLLSVVGAFVALAFQVKSGTRIDGLSGIDINMCKLMMGYGV